MNDFSWDDDLFDDDDFLDDDQDNTDEDGNDSYEEEPEPPVKKKDKPKKEPKSPKGGMFRKKPVEKKTAAGSSPDMDEQNDGYDDDDDYDRQDVPEEKVPAPKKKPQREHVHGLKKSGSKGAKGAAGKIAAVGLIAAAVVAAGAIGSTAMNGQIKSLRQSNQNLTDQIASQSMNVYTAKRDIKKGDELITSGDQANVELSQVYTSLPETDYISSTTTGYAQVDISAGEPVMANTIGDTNPVSELNDAIAAVKAEDNKAKELPYKITADFVDLNTGNTLAESRDLLLDSGANEKAFNTEAESIDGYVLKSIQVDKEGVHAFGVSEKSMKEGVVTMYYFTSKGGWGRHEIKGNIRVTFGYVKKDDPSLQDEDATDVMDDSAWIQTEDENAAEAASGEESEAPAEETKKESDAAASNTASSDTASSSTASSGQAASVQTAAKTQPAARQKASAPAVKQQASSAQSTADTENASAGTGQTSSMSEPDDAGVSVETETIGIDDAE